MDETDGTMIRHVCQRLVVASIRFAAVALALLLVMEFAYGVLGGSDRHVWQPGAYDAVPAALAASSTEWGGLLRERWIATGRVLLVALPSIWLAGCGWGVLGARLRRYRMTPVLAAPFAALACAPGFWVVVLAAVYSYIQWQRPGFADELVVEEGPDLLTWWHAAVVALPAVAAGIAWQIREVSGLLEGEAARPWVRSQFIDGADDEEIFYRRILRRSAAPLAALLDRSLPPLLGSLLILETAFRYPGVGALLVDSVRLPSYGGVLLASLSLVALATLATLCRELLVPPPRPT